MIPAIEQKYRSILKNIEELYYEVDLAGNLTFCNDSMSKILGYTKDELLGMNNRQYMDEETSKKVYQMFNQVYRTGVPAKAFDWELVGKDGVRRIVETSVSLMHDSESQPIGFYGIGRDITERKRTENALRESEKRYRAIFEGSREAIYVTTPEGEIVDANQSMVDLFGYGREEMMGLNVRRTYVYPEDRRKFQQQIEREGFVRDYEIALCKKDGTEMECLLTASVRRADDGGLLGYQGIIRDVTEHKQILKALRMEKQRLQTLSENAPFGMVMIDQAGTFRYINPKFKELFGYDLTDVPDGKTWFRKAYPDSLYRHDVISVWKEDLNSFKPGEKRSRVFTVTGKDGTEKIINFIPVQLETDENLMACEDVTAREQAEAALRQSEEKYRTILNSIEEGYYEVDLAGNFTFFNDFLARSLGYTREELKGLNNRQYMSPETAKLVFSTFNEVYRTGNPKRDFEWELINKDGTKRFVEVSVSLMRDGKGQPKGYFGTARDITERKKEEDALKEWEKKYRLTLQNLDVEYFEVDLKGKFTFFTDILSRILGYSKEELMGMDNRQYQSEETANKLYQVFNEVYRTGKPSKIFDWEVIRKDGTKRVAETSQCLMLDSRGQPVGFCGIARDVTERKKSEMALKESEEKYRTILESIEDGYYEVDTGGNLVFFNESMAKILGYRPEEMIGMNNRKYMSAETSKKVFETFNKVFRTGKATKAFDWELIRKDGTVRYVETSVSAVYDSFGRPKGFRGIARDVTEQKFLEKAKEGVINLLSHELRTPLSIIGGVFAGIGRQLQKENVSGLERIIERGMRSLKRLLDLQVKVDDILHQKLSRENDGTLRLIESALGIVEELKEDVRVGESERAALESFSRRLESVYKTEAVRWEKIDAADLVREVVQEAGSLMGGRDVEIQMDVHAGLALEMDRSNLKKVCGGLLRNAIENTPDEGKVEIQAVSREKSIHFSFRDYGIGITEQNQKLIFGGFFHNRDTAMYSSKDWYQFNAGGTGVDLLRTKVFSERYKFQVGFESRRCRFLPRDEDACPGRISKCSFVKDRGECFSSGGSTFRIAFPRSGGL